MAAPCLSGPSDRLAALGESLLSGSSLDDGLLCELADLIQVGRQWQLMSAPSWLPCPPEPLTPLTTLPRRTRT